MVHTSQQLRFTTQSNPTQPLRKKKTMTNITCPICDSSRIETLNYAKKAGGTIGTAAGGVAGYTGAMSGAKVGASVGVVGGPVGVAVGGFIGALLGAVVGGSAGCVAGAKLGAVVDNTIMHNYHCLDCDYTFGKSRN